MSNEEKPDEPKIIVDSDWKEQVAQEKLASQESRQEESSQAEQPAASSDDSSDSAQSMPPVSFTLLVTSLATQALVSLGKFPDPVSGETTVSKEQAKHYIDLLGVLEEKTKGNLDNEEKELLEGSLHQLRMLFVT
ncbi:MAG: DUF1844 domain-containing protein [Pirellulaceae bacterium]|nr:DUF1844 domain-containing protein [Pirellulaceae bacterium]